MVQKGYNNVTNSLGNSIAQKFGYNGKELEESLGLNWLEYGARSYDASLGRWMSPDPLAERIYELTPYNYTVNNPIAFIDPTGQWFIFFFEKGEKGEEQREYITNALNKLLGEEFSIGWENNKNGSSILKINGKGDKNKLSKAGKALYDSAKDENYLSVISITENDEKIGVGSFALQKIDIGDVKNLTKEKGGDTTQGLLIHEMFEQYEKSKEGIKSGKILKNGSLSAFKKAHNSAIEIENNANGNKRLNENERNIGSHYIKYFEEQDGTITEVKYTRGNKVMQVTKKSHPKGSKPWKK